MHALQALRAVVTVEPWIPPLRLWLEHVRRGDLPYVPWLLYAASPADAI